MKAKLTREQIQSWIAYASIRPIGDERADIRTALQTVRLREVWRTDDGEPEDPRDFMPQFETYEPDEERPTLEQIKLQSQLEAAQFGL